MDQLALSNSSQVLPSQNVLLPSLSFSIAYLGLNTLEFAILVKISCRALLLKIRSMDQQHQHSLGANEKCRIPGLQPAILKQNLHFNRFVCTRKFEKHRLVQRTPSELLSGLTHIVSVRRAHCTLPMFHPQKGPFRVQSISEFPLECLNTLRKSLLY